MKIHSFILCSALAINATSAQAAESDAPASAQVAGPGKTRAEVRAETLRALANGEVPFGDVDFPRTTGTVSPPSGKSRADVKAETRQALAAGEVAFGDVAYPKPAATRDAGQTRAAVKAELLRSIAAHEYRFSDAAYPDSGIVTTPRTRHRAKSFAATPAPAPSTTPAS